MPTPRAALGLQLVIVVYLIVDDICVHHLAEWWPLSLLLCGPDFGGVFTPGFTVDCWCLSRHHHWSNF